MFLTWRVIIRIFIFTTIISKVKANPDNWRIIESLAEEHPYIVGLMNGFRAYKCTGIIISKGSVLTSGTCIIPAPKYVAVGMAVLGSKSNKNSIISVASTKLHGDYTFESKPGEANVTRMHSNLGIVFVIRPVLELFIQALDLGDYFASELKEKKLTVVGFGKLSHTYAVVLQQQDYHQAPCSNPKWYYCVCGNDYTKSSRTYELEFGNGAPVLFGRELVGVAAAPSGKLSLNATDTKYNIFTVLGPYLPWIKKSEYEAKVKLTLRARNNVNYNQKGRFFQYLYTILFYLISKVIN